jgi:hypothetical protein
MEFKTSVEKPNDCVSAALLQDRTERRRLQTRVQAFLRAEEDTWVTIITWVLESDG